VDILVYNAGPDGFKSVEEITPEKFEASWRVNAHG
jgi:NAD(P)-dependent dehydrogenase (short-subunit alcohol dehydrogenase family)